MKKKNEFLQTFFRIRIRVVALRPSDLTDHLKKRKRAHRQYMAPRFFYQKGHDAQKKGHGVMIKGHSAAPFYFS